MIQLNEGEYGFNETKYSHFLCFSVHIRTNKLVFHHSERYTPEQQETHDLIKSLHNSGMGYRKISYYLIKQGIKTSKGNLWDSSNVHSVLKRNRERLIRLENQKHESEIEYGKMELVWLKDNELYKNPRKDILQVSVP